MEFCKRCGHYLSENDMICPECGLDLHPIIIIDRGPYRYRYPVFFLTLIAFAVLGFYAILAFDVYIFFFFVPFIFIRGDYSGPFRYFNRGMMTGMMIALIAFWIYKYSGMF